MVLKLEKCHFISKSIDYFGHVIAPGKLQVAKTTIKAIELLRYSEDISQMRSFLKLCNVSRRFVPEFAMIAASSNKKFKQKVLSHFALNDKNGRAVNELKNRFVCPAVVALPRANRQYTVDTDASVAQMECILSQEQGDSVLKPIGY